MTAQAHGKEDHGVLECLTMSPLSQFRRLLMVIPPCKNARSLETDVDMIDK